MSSASIRIAAVMAAAAILSGAECGVTEPADESFILWASDTLFKVGDTIRMVAEEWGHPTGNLRPSLVVSSTLDPSAFGWSSSDPAIAVIDSLGYAAFKAAGTVQVTVRSPHAKATKRVRAVPPT